MELRRLRFIFFLCHRSTLVEEVGERLVPEGSPVDGTRRTVVEVALPEGTGVTGEGRICGGVWTSSDEQRTTSVQCGSSGSCKKGKPASEF